MKTKLDYLKEMGILEILPQEVIDMIKMERYGREELIVMEAFQTGKAWRIIEGRVKVTLYTAQGQEYFGEFKSGEWVGVASALLEGNATADIESKDDTVLLMIPLKKIIESYPDIMVHLWERVARGSALEFVRFLGGSLAKAVLSNEGYFLQYISENDMEITFSNTKELSELLNTNLRTLQRIIRKLKDEGVIEKNKNKIWVIDEDKFEKALLKQTEKY